MSEVQSRVLSEDEFLTQVEGPELDVARLRDALTALVELGALSQADTRARLLQEILLERGRMLDALDLLADRIRWLGEVESGWLRKELAAFATASPELPAMMEEIALGLVPPRESVRRLRTLMELNPGRFVYHKTWGFGVVGTMDRLERRVEVDFETRKGHRLTWAYAAEALQLLHDHHLFVLWHRDPGMIQQWVRDQPGEIVRRALADFGPMTVVQLQALLSPRIVPPEEWKAFWESARRQLKDSGTVEIPSRRSEPLRLIDRSEQAADRQLSRLLQERDPDEILARLQRLLEVEELPAEYRDALAERLAYVVRSLTAAQPARRVRAVVLARKLGLEPERFPLDPHLAEWRDGQRLLEALNALSGREVREFTLWLFEQDRTSWSRAVLSLLNDLRSSALTEVLDLLLADGHEPEVVARMRELVTRRALSVAGLLWFHRNPQWWTAWKLGSWADFTRLALLALEKDAAGEELRAQNALRERMEKLEWLAELFGQLDPNDREDLFNRFRATSAWSPIDRRAVVGRIVKVCPELLPLLSESPATKVEQRRVTSERSYRARAEQLRKIIEVEIPRNSREIALARSYGDLRENFEYKAAKDMQGLLLRRKAELEQALKEVQPTTFEGVSTSVVSPGVGVEVEYADGRREKRWILGVWDSDDALNIVSSEAAWARSLLGRSVGDRVRLPGPEGETEATIVAIEPLSEEIRTWVRGERSG
jgi:transcription elongation GreA/GreB family factor